MLQQVPRPNKDCNAEVSACYPDTVAVFSRFRDMDKPSLQALRRYGFSIKPNRFGWRIWINLPSLEQLLLLKNIQQKIKMSISRLDIAWDCQCHDADQASEIKEWLSKHFRLKWRRREGMHEEYATVYWNAKYKRRNLVTYDSKINRHTGEVDGCVHVELRLHGADTIRKQGIFNIRDLLTANLGLIIRKHVRQPDLLDDRQVTKLIRNGVKDNREYYRGKHLSTFMDQYSATIPVRIRSILKKAGLSDEKERAFKSFDNLVKTCKLDSYYQLDDFLPV